MEQSSQKAKSTRSLEAVIWEDFDDEFVFAKEFMLLRAVKKHVTVSISTRPRVADTSSLPESLEMRPIAFEGTLRLVLSGKGYV